MTTSIRTSFDPQVTTALFDNPAWHPAVYALPEKIDALENSRNWTNWKDTSQNKQPIEAVLLVIRDNLLEDIKKSLITPSSGVLHLDRKHDLSENLFFKASSSDIVPLVARIGEVYSSELNDASCDLSQAREEAREEGFPPPSDIALKNAERLLREMYGISSRRFEVYPTPDGEIAIDAPDGEGRSVILLCDSEGGALCLVNLNGHHRRARYSTTETLPDGFVREALAELKL